MLKLRSSWPKFFGRLAGILFVVCAFAIFCSQICADDSEYESPATFFIAPNGSDSWSGRLADVASDGSDGPFATFQRAREAARSLKKESAPDTPIVIEVRGGLYTLSETLVFSSEDGGLSKDRPVIWRAKKDEVVKINGGVFLNSYKKLEDEAIASKLKPEVRGKVIAFDLNGSGIEDLGSADTGVELFFQGAPTTLARYPNDEFVKIAAVQREGTKEVVSHGRKGVAEGIFFYDDEELDKCAEEPDLWADGYWFWDWSEQPSLNPT